MSKPATLYHGRRATLAGINPTRVLVDAKTGKAVSPRQYEDVNGDGIRIVFVRDDGWSIAANEATQELAGTMWDYIGYWKPAYHEDRHGVALHPYPTEPDHIDDEATFQFYMYDPTPRTVGQVKTAKYGLCDILIGRYRDGNRVSIELVGAKGSKHQGEPIATVSSNVVHAQLNSGEFCVRVHELGSLVDDLGKCDLFEVAERAGRPLEVPSGFVAMPVWRIR